MSLRHFAQVADRLVADGFDGLPERVLQVLGNREGVLVAVLVEAVEQALAVGRQEGVPVEQRRRRLQGGVLAPAEDLVEVEAEQPVVRPLPPLDQQDAVEGEQQHPARRVVPPEDAARDHVVPGGVEQFLRRRRLPVELGWVRVESERVVAFALRVEGVEHEELRRPVAEAVGREGRQRVAVVEVVVSGTPAVPEGAEEGAEPGALEPQPGLGAAFPLVLGAAAAVVGGEGAELVVRGLVAVRGVLAPGVGGRADVASEDLGEVVVAVELVLVVDADERRRRLGPTPRHSLLHPRSGRRSP